jgi:hypothetical protein
MKAIIHVNQHIVKANRKNGTTKPVLTVKTYNSNEYGHEVTIDGPSKVVYSPDKPLSCGAHVWIEADYEDVSVWTVEEVGMTVIDSQMDLIDYLEERKM